MTGNKNKRELQSGINTGRRKPMTKNNQSNISGLKSCDMSQLSDEQYKNVSDAAEHLSSEIREIVQMRKTQAALAVNAAQVLLYRDIGEYLVTKGLQEEQSKYGKAIVKEISRVLTAEYGPGFTAASLSRMMNFFLKFPDTEKVLHFCKRLTWSHFVELVPIDDDLKREFYAVMCYNEQWTVRVLRERKNSMLFERTAISKRPELTIKNDLAVLSEEGKMSPDLFYRDPYILDFLGLKDTYSEKDLENAILDELEKFILEFGSDFAFMARQKHFILDGEDKYMDLVFYHRSLHRLVLVELKLGKFEPEFKGQVELYLRWLDKHERLEGEESPIALILCAEKPKETIELLELDHGSIRVAEYLVKMPPKDVLEEKLSKAVELAKKRLEMRAGSESGN